MSNHQEISKLIQLNTVPIIKKTLNPKNTHPRKSFWGGRLSFATFENKGELILVLKMGLFLGGLAIIYASR